MTTKKYKMVKSHLIFDSLGAMMTFTFTKKRIEHVVSFCFNETNIDIQEMYSHTIYDKIKKVRRFNSLNNTIKHLKHICCYDPDDYIINKITLFNSGPKESFWIWYANQNYIKISDNVLYERG